MGPRARPQRQRGSAAGRSAPRRPGRPAQLLRCPERAARLTGPRAPPPPPAPSAAPLRAGLMFTPLTCFYLKSQYGAGSCLGRLRGTWVVGGQGCMGPVRQGYMCPGRGRLQTAVGVAETLTPPRTTDGRPLRCPCLDATPIPTICRAPARAAPPPRLGQQGAHQAVRARLCRRHGRARPAGGGAVKGLCRGHQHGIPRFGQRAGGGCRVLGGGAGVLGGAATRAKVQVGTGVLGVGWACRAGRWVLGGEGCRAGSPQVVVQPTISMHRAGGSPVRCSIPDCLPNACPLPKKTQSCCAWTAWRWSTWGTPRR